MPPELGKLIVAVGAGIIVLGVIIWSGALGWFGRLPGDIRLERESLRVYVPIVSMLLLSAAVSLILYLIRRFF